MWLRNLLLSLIVFYATSIRTAAEESKKPHIIIILADDLGWNDVGFHGSDQIMTPNIDALGYNGVILNQHYVQPLCTPTRAALLTGKYPIHLGMQHAVIIASQGFGLPLAERLLPEHLKEAGYQTSMIGKWHLGCARSEYTPTFRGFDNHFGFWNGFQDYYNQSHDEAPFGFNYSGLDLRRDLTADWKSQGGYSTDMFTDEGVKIIESHKAVDGPLFLYLAHSAPHAANDYQLLQAPQETIDKFKHIRDKDRLVYAAMVSKLDDSVGRIMTALSAKKMLENSIVVFMADNGAPSVGFYANHGSNYPLRGIKYTAMEGAMRSASAIFSPLIKSRKQVSQQLMHVTDWLPTLYSAAGLNVKKLGNIDGKDLWDALVKGKQSPRNTMVYNIDSTEFAALRSEEFKFIKGTVRGGMHDGWFGRIDDKDVQRSPEYNTDSILNSQTNQAIKTLPRVEPLTKEQITALRTQATVVCGEEMPTSDETNQCQAGISPCLFNLTADPCERTNLAVDRQDLIKHFQEQVGIINKTALPIVNTDYDPKSDPQLYGNVWSSWLDDVANGAEISTATLHIVFLLLTVLSTLYRTLVGLYNQHY